MKKNESPQVLIPVDDGVDMHAVKDPCRQPVTVLIYRYEDLPGGAVVQATIECVITFDRAGAINGLKAGTVHKELCRNGKKLLEISFRSAPLPIRDLHPEERARAAACAGAA